MEQSTINIVSNGPYPSNICSNLAPTPYMIDGQLCSSFEGFLQAIKYSDLSRQQDILCLYGLNAKRAGKESNDQHGPDRKVYWQGQILPYRSAEHMELLRLSLICKFSQNIQARRALAATGSASLTHDTGHPESPHTSLPADIFIQYLYEIRTLLFQNRL